MQHMKLMRSGSLVSVPSTGTKSRRMSGFILAVGTSWMARLRRTQWAERRLVATSMTMRLKN